MTDSTMWMLLSGITAAMLVGLFSFYRRLSSIQKQVTRLSDDETSSLASLIKIPPLMKELQQALLDARNDSVQVQRLTSDSLSKIADNAINSWNTFQKAVAILNDDARNVAAVIENGNKALAANLAGYKEVLTSLQSNNQFFESQATDMRSEAMSMRQAAFQITQDVPVAVRTVQGSVSAGFAEIRTRAINDQLTVYPRRLAIELDERETYLDLIAQQPGLWTMPGGSEGNVRFRLVCENANCQNLNTEGKKEVYTSEFVYELKAPARVDCTYLPRAGDIEKFFDAADIAGLTDQFEVAGKALLAVKLGLTISQYAHPVFAVGVIVLEAGLEDVVRRLQADVKDRQATRKLWELVRSSPYQIKDVGGPGHTQFGNLIRLREESKGSHVHKSFGGLSKWMNPETQTFCWVCPTDAYNFIAQYRADATRASRSGGVAA